MDEQSKARRKVHRLRSGQAVDFRKEIKWGKKSKVEKECPGLCCSVVRVSAQATKAADSMPGLLGCMQEATK